MQLWNKKEWRNERITVQNLRMECYKHMNRAPEIEFKFISHLTKYTANSLEICFIQILP
jgi:hypothetical protein